MDRLRCLRAVIRLHGSLGLFGWLHRAQTIPNERGGYTIGPGWVLVLTFPSELLEHLVSEDPGD